MTSGNSGVGSTEMALIGVAAGCAGAVAIVLLFFACYLCSNCLKGRAPEPRNEVFPSLFRNQQVVSTTSSFSSAEQGGHELASPGGGRDVIVEKEVAVTVVDR